MVPSMHDAYRWNTVDAILIKGTVSRDFLLLVFSWINFPQASDYTIRAVLNFFENSRRYSQLKVCHRCQRHRWQIEKIFNQKNFYNFFWSPLGSRGNIYINFCLQVHFQVSAAWYCSNYLPPVSTKKTWSKKSRDTIPLSQSRESKKLPKVTLSTQSKSY